MSLLKPVTLSLSSHTIQSVNNNPWRHWKDPQTSQVNKWPDIFRKCPTGTKLRLCIKNPRKVNIPFGATAYLMLHRHHKIEFCIKMGRSASHSFINWCGAWVGGGGWGGREKSHRRLSINHNFWKAGWTKTDLNLKSFCSPAGRLLPLNQNINWTWS